jgi:hypothetical protein
LDPKDYSIDESVVVQPYKENIGIVNFSSIMDIADREAISCLEAMNLISSAHHVNECVATVYQAKLYEDANYRQAVLESMNDIKMQYIDAGTDAYLDRGLEESVSLSLENNNTEPIDLFLEGMWDWLTGKGANEYQNLANVGRTVSRWVSKKTDQALSNIGDNMTNGALNALNNTLNDPQKRENLENKGAQALQNLTKKGIEKVTDTVRDKAKPYLTGAKAGVTAATVLGGGLAVFNALTNQETINKTNNPGVITRMINSLNKMQNILTGKWRNSPPQQQGIISKIIAKIKWAIQALGRKVGLVK